MEDELIYEMLDHSYDEAVKRLKKSERNGLIAGSIE
jgi:predicted DNA-binding protein (MmcQ/YjbR family)